MNWLRKYFKYLFNIMNKIKIPMSSKPKRPRIQNVFILDLIDGEPVLREKFIIVNDKGETLDAPIFFSKKEAEDWLDEIHPKNNYAPE